MRKKDILPMALVAVGVVVAYEVYKTKGAKPGGLKLGL